MSFSANWRGLALIVLAKDMTPLAWKSPNLGSAVRVSGWNSSENSGRPLAVRLMIWSR